MLELVEARYKIALQKLVFRAALVVSISGMAQVLSNLVGG